MEFKENDENYVYGLIGKNIKKYRKIKGWTQQKLADEINYSLSFISNVEAKTHQTFSLGALWRISKVLDVDLYKLCLDEEDEHKKVKYILYTCKNCNEEVKIPIEIVKHFLYLNKLKHSKDIPTFKCTNCNDNLEPTDFINYV